MVILANEWSSGLHGFIQKVTEKNFLTDMTIAISKLFELPVMGKVRTQVEVVESSSEKFEKLFELIKNVSLKKV